MTTRPPLGSQRPSQPSLGGNVHLGQRTPSHREYSSSNRRTESHVDSANEGESPRGLSKNVRLKPIPSRSSSAVGSPRVNTEVVSKYPRGKPRLQFDIPSIKLEGESNVASPAMSLPQEEISHAPIPMPVRPGRRTRPTIPKQRTQPTSAVKKDARPRPYTLDVPTIAPHYPPNGESKLQARFRRQLSIIAGPRQGICLDGRV